MRSQRAIRTKGEDMNARKKLIGTIVLGAALLVPVAQAQSPDDRAGPRGPGGIAAMQTAASSSHPDNRAVRGPGAVETTVTGVAVRPDDGAAARGPGAYDPDGAAGSSHPDNRAATRGPGSFETVVTVSAEAGFDWGDALIGGLGGMGVALLLTGCLFLLAGQRNRARLA
jgi:hypothetical protein